jgi:hypothetical protein
MHATKEPHLLLLLLQEGKGRDKSAQSKKLQGDRNERERRDQDDGRRGCHEDSSGRRERYEQNGATVLEKEQGRQAKPKLRSTVVVRDG